MKTVYLDNAATTQIDDQVIEVVHSSMKNNYGNPSSIHQYGRKAKTAVESARKEIAKHLHVSSSEICLLYTSDAADE